MAASVVLATTVVIPASRAGDDADEPLKKLMKTIDARTKAIRDATSTTAKFKGAGNGKDLVPLADELARLGKDTRGFRSRRRR